MRIVDIVAEVGGDLDVLVIGVGAQPRSRSVTRAGVVVTPELLQRVAAMPATRRHTAWGFRWRAALANMIVPREQQCYPRSVPPAEKFQHEVEQQ